MLQYRLLGPLEVAAEGAALALGGPRQRAVLARLLVDVGRVVSTDALVDAVWGDEPPPTAVKTLQKYVVELRKSLGPGVLLTRGRGYVLAAASEQVDALCFERLMEDASKAERAGDLDRAIALRGEAEGLWRGDVLCDRRDAAFVAPERARLEELRVASLETALELELARGHHGEVVARAAELIELYPFRERLWSALILSLYQSGRQVDALRAYERYRQTLAQELGLEPSDSLRALEVAILHHDAEIAPRARGRDGPFEGNLPQWRTSLVGRTGELAAVETAVARHCLVTLTGTGGVGKTRLAVEAARRLAARYPGGCWFVDLSAVEHGDLVARAVADALSISEQPGEDLDDSVTEALSHRPALLLVLDNCEHVLAGCVAAVRRILAGAPLVTVLATSGQPLGVGEEHVVAVAPLAFAVAGTGAHPPAVQLFVERAHEALAGFELSEDDIEAATRICGRVDGLPLAIELAASQVRVLEPAEIAARLDDRLRFASPSGTPSRQRTLEVAIGWSYDRLPPLAREVFDRISVFVESCSLEAVEAVATPGVTRRDVLEAVTALVDGSLLMRERGPVGAARYRLLETLRLYGLQRLEQSGRLRSARRAHALFFLGLAEAASPHLFGPDERTWKERLDAEEANVRAALAWAIDQDRDLAARLAVALVPYWSLGWTNAQGVEFLLPLVERRAQLSPELRAPVLTAAAHLSAETGEARLVADWAEEAGRLFERGADLVGVGRAQLTLGAALGNQGALEEAEGALAEANAAARAAKDDVFLAMTLEAQGLVAARRGDFVQSRHFHLLEVDAWARVGSLAGRSAALLLLAYAARSLGDLDAAAELSRRAGEGFTASANPNGASHALSALADVARLRGDVAAAEATYAEALAAFQANGDRRCAASTNKNLAVMANQRGDHDGAASLLVECVRLRCALGDEAGLAECLEEMARTALSTGRATSAATLLAAASAIRTATGARESVEDRASASQLLGEVKRLVDGEQFERAWTLGRNLKPDDLALYTSELWALRHLPGGVRGGRQ